MLYNRKKTLILHYVFVVVVLFCFMLTASTVFAEGGKEGAEEGVPTVRIISWSQGFVWPELFGKTGVDETDRLKTFEEKEGIDIEVEWGDEVSLRQKLAMDLMSGTGRYDIIYIGSYTGVNTYGPTGYAEPLNDYIDNHPTDYLDLSDIYPKTLEANTIDGVLYGLPYYFNGPGMIYRSDILKKYGLDVPKTMDEFMDVCEALKRGLERDGLSHITPVTMRAAPVQGPSIDIAGFVYAYAGYPAWFEGGPITAAEIKKNKARPIFNEDFAPGFRAFTDIIKKYGPPGAATHTWADMMNIYAQGTAVILIPSTINGFAGWNISEDENVVKYTKFAPPPVGPTGVAIENFWTMSFGINSDSTHKLAAWKVLTLLTSKEAAIAFAEQTQWPCVCRKSALFHDTLVNKYGLDQIELIETMYTEGNPYFFPYFPEIAEFAERITMFASKVVSGEMETDAALDSLQAWAFEKMLREGYYR